MLGLRPQRAPSTWKVGLALWQGSKVNSTSLSAALQKLNLPASKGWQTCGRGGGAAGRG